MALVLPATYKDITGDNTLSDPQIVTLLARAVTRLEDRLDRKLESAQRTERMYPTRDGSLWPHAIPITVAPDGYAVDGNRLYGSTPFGPSWPDTVPGVEVTYTGGWVERSANPTAANRLPVCIEEDLAIAAYFLGHPASLAAAAAVPAGATSVRLGDAAVTYGPNGAPAGRPSRIVWSSATMGYRYLRIGGEPC